MTCPTFSDRDQANIDMMGPPTAQEHLRRAMRVSTDPRWVERQLCNGPDIIERHPVPVWRMVGWVVFAVAAAVLLVSAARAEQTRAYEIVAYPAGKDMREDRPNLITIAGPFGREECRIAIASVKLANGSRLRCDRIEERRVR